MGYTRATLFGEGAFVFNHLMYNKYLKCKIDCIIGMNNAKVGSIWIDY